MACKNAELASNFRKSWATVASEQKKCFCMLLKRFRCPKVNTTIHMLWWKRYFRTGTSWRVLNSCVWGCHEVICFHGESLSKWEDLVRKEILRHDRVRIVTVIWRLCLFKASADSFIFVKWILNLYTHLLYPRQTIGFWWVPCFDLNAVTQYYFLRCTKTHVWFCWVVVMRKHFFLSFLAWWPFKQMSQSQR